MDIMDSLQNGFSRLLEFLKVRQLELRNPQGQRIFKLALTWVAALVVLALVTHLFTFVAIGTVVLLVLKFRFTVVKELNATHYDKPERPS